MAMNLRNEKFKAAFDKLALNELRVKELTNNNIVDVRNLEDGKPVKIAGVITWLNVPESTKDGSMALFTIEDTSGVAVQVVAFSKLYKTDGKKLFEGAIAIVAGCVDRAERDVNTMIIASQVVSLEDVVT